MATLLDVSETTIVSEVVDTARYLGIRGIPDAERMTTGRVWPRWPRMDRRNPKSAEA